MMSVREVPERQTRTQALQEESGALQEGAGHSRRAAGDFAVRAGFLSPAGIFLDSAKLSLYDSSHLTAVAPAGKLEPELVNFIHTQLHTHKDCSWHVR